MTALHLLVVVVTAVTAVALYPPPYSPVDTAYKPDYNKPEYDGKPAYAPVYDGKPVYKKPEYDGKPTYAPVYDSKPVYKKPEYDGKPSYDPVYDGKPDYKKPEYDGKPSYDPVYDGKPDYKKPEYGRKPAYHPVYDGKTDYKKPEYEGKPDYAPVYDSKPDYKSEYESKPAYAPVYDGKLDYEDKPNYDPVYDSKPYGGKYSSSSVSGADVKSANEAVRVVINKKDELYKDLDIYETFNGVAAERINLINQRVLPAITLDNSQTDASIALLDQEISALRDRAARADVTVSAALASANASSDVIRQQRALVAQIAKNNTDDAHRIAQYQDDLRKFETYFLKELDARLDQLNSLLAKERQNLKTVTTFVDGRKCEYGFIGLWNDASPVSIPFVSQFTQSPIVDIVLSGYVSFINVPFASDRYPPGNSYPPHSTYGDDTKGDDSSYKNDVQKVQVVVSDVTAHGFTARVINSNPVNFYVSKVTAKYVACQNLNNEVYL